MRVKLDLNSPDFQKELFGLSKPDQSAVLRTLQKVSQLSWEQIYRDKGLRWEAIHSKVGPTGSSLYSLRITQKCRATACREGDWLCLLSLHPDHDSAYQP